MLKEISFINNRTGEIVYFAKPLKVHDDLYLQEDIDEARINIIWDFDSIYKEKTGMKDGLAEIDHKDVDQIKEILSPAIDLLKDDEEPKEFWEITEGNAKKILKSILEITNLCPVGCVCVIE